MAYRDDRIADIRRDADAEYEEYFAEQDAAAAAAAGITLEEYRRREQAHYEEAQREDDEREAAGGRTICPECGERTVVETTRPTRQYGGGTDTFYRCERCPYAEVCV